MKYISAFPLVATLAAAQMQVMSLAPAPSGPNKTNSEKVTVGGMKAVSTGMAPVLGFSPESITAAVGDTVEFVFMQKNHTATQSTFAEPCKAMEGGKDSGFMPNPEGKAGVTWNITVDSTDAQWFYCKQATHCGVGMVFAINAATTGDKTMSVFKNNAINKNSTKSANLGLAPIQSVNPAAAAAPSTVTVAAASGTGAAGSTATVVAGQGTDTAGNACGCQCLCGVNSFPQAAAVNNFGGFAGMLP
ncbi:serine-threonine rich protein [Paraphaeosphaeria sporulosa]